MEAQPRHWQNAIETDLLPLIKVDKLGIVVDMDGTISHIAEQPQAAFVTPRNRELLGTLVLMLPLVAAVSGRAVRDLKTRVAVPGMVYIGNHGLEWLTDTGRMQDSKVRQYRKMLAAALAELEPQLTIGMWIEDKHATASVHYRMAPRPAEAAQVLKEQVDAVAEKYGLLAFPGQKLFELRPPINVNKGTALQRLVDKYDLDAVLYIGDDLTDVDALKIAQAMRDDQSCYAIGIGVISDDNENSHIVAEASSATANSVGDVEELLAWLLKEISAERLA